MVVLRLYVRVNDLNASKKPIYQANNKASLENLISNKEKKTPYFFCRNINNNQIHVGTVWQKKYLLIKSPSNQSSLNYKFMCTNRHNCVCILMFYYQVDLSDWKLLLCLLRMPTLCLSLRHWHKRFTSFHQDISSSIFFELFYSFSSGISSYCHHEVLYTRKLFSLLYCASIYVPQ